MKPNVDSHPLPHRESNGQRYGAGTVFSAGHASLTAQSRSRKPPGCTDVWKPLPSRLLCFTSISLTDKTLSASPRPCPLLSSRLSLSPISGRRKEIPVRSWFVFPTSSTWFSASLLSPKHGSTSTLFCNTVSFRRYRFQFLVSVEKRVFHLRGISCAQRKVALDLKWNGTFLPNK